MPRLIHTSLITAICLVCASSAFARQQHSKSVLPPTLQLAIVKGEPASEMAAARSSGDPFVQGDTRNQSSTQQNNRPPMKQVKGISRRVTGNTATPAPALTEPRHSDPFGSAPKPMQRSFVDLSRTKKYVQDFGTVMTFPAADGLGRRSLSQRQPKILNQDFHPAPVSSAIKPQLASSPIRSGGKSNLVLPSSATRNANNSVRLPNQAGIGNRNQVAAQPDPMIRATIIGPELLIQDYPDQFEIEVTNTSTQMAQNITVQMDISDSFQVSDFDRPTSVDLQNGTVSWKLDSLPGGYKNVIHFRASSGTLGSCQQGITVEMQNTLQVKTGFVTLVIENPDSKKLPRPAINNRLQDRN